MNISDIKREALAYKEELLAAKEDLDKVSNIQGSIATGLSDLNSDILDMDNEPKAPKAKKEPQEVTFAKKSKKSKKDISKQEDEVDV